MSSRDSPETKLEKKTGAMSPLLQRFSSPHSHTLSPTAEGKKKRNAGYSCNSSRHKGFAGLCPRENASVEGVAGFGTGEVSLVLSGNHTVCIDTLGGSANDGLEVLAEIGRLELRVQLGGEMVSQVLGIFGVVVTSNTPGVLVFGEVARDELDRVEGVGFTGLPSGDNSTADSFFGDLCDREYREL